MTLSIIYALGIKDAVLPGFQLQLCSMVRESSHIAATQERGDCVELGMVV